MIPPIFTTLSANAGVTAIIGAGDSCRVYPFGYAKQGTVIPYVTWFKVSGQPVNKLTKGSFTDKIRAQVDCWAADSAGALALARAVRASLETKGYMVGLNLTERDIETRLYRYSMDFEFIVNRGVAGVVAPVADFVGSVVSGNAPLTVNFTDLSTNTPTSWSWNFGDATTSTAQNPTKIYTVPGVYTVTLIATNAAGSDTRIRASYIVAAFNPASLFAGGYQGAWYDPSDLSTMFQDSAGTIPVTADGDPVGKILDKSGNGNHATQSTSGARPLYKTSGGLHWLEFDGINDSLQTASINATSASTSAVFYGCFPNSTSGFQGHYEHGTAGFNGSFYVYSNSTTLEVKETGSTGNSYGIYPGYVASKTVFTHQYDLGGATAADCTKVRKNTSSVSLSNSPSVAGASTWQNGVFKIGTSAGVYFPGKLYQLVLVFKAPSGTEITNTETFINNKTGAY